jgi:uncharacterized protein YjbJ (UPF0337 family)
VGITDKVTGKVKQVASALKGDEQLEGRGQKEERKADVKDERDRQKARVERETRRVEAGAGDKDDQERLKDERAWEKGREKQVESLEKQT